jgi:hypothetical protein
MKRLVLAAAVSAVAATAVPAGADATICLGGVTVRHGDTVVRQDLGCHTIDTP